MLENDMQQVAPVVKTLKTVDSVVNWQLPLLAVLFVSVIFVAIKTVVHRHESRTQFMQLQVLEKERDKLAAQWSRLKLEQGTMLNQVRVEQNARWELGMQMPKTSEIRMIREPAKKSFLVVDNSSAQKASSVSKVALGK
ncbi:MAG: cell division protein FtsL [Cocleimonas sp.]